MKKIVGFFLILGAAMGPLAAAPGDRWIHVRVDDAGDDHARVDLQLPVGLVATLLPAIKGKHGLHVDHLDCGNVDMDELRGYWNAVRSAKDGEYVTVRGEDSEVRVSKSSGLMLVSVNEPSGGSRLRMKIPIPLVDAVLAGGDTIDLEALRVALEKAPTGELLTVDDDDSHIRVWIDGDAAPARGDR